MTRLAPVFRLSLLAIAAALPASAGGLNLGTVAKVPAVTGFSSQPAGVGSFTGAGMNVSNADGVSVQNKINASRNVQAGSNVTINETINGVPVGYGAGGNFLAGDDAQAQAIWAQKQALYQQLRDEA